MRSNRAQVQIGVWLTAALALALTFSAITHGALAAGTGDIATPAPTSAPAHIRVAAASLPLPPRPKPLPNGGITTQGVRLSSRLSEDAPPIGTGVRWTVTAIAGNIPPIESEDAYPSIELEPGTYRARAVVGLVRAEAEFTIVAGEVKRVHLPLNAGQIEVAVATGAATPALNQALIHLRPANQNEVAQTDGAEIASPLLTVHGGHLQAVLPAGQYDIEATLGAVTSNQRIEVEAGTSSQATIDLEVGYIVAEALAAEGTEPLTSALFSLRRIRDGADDQGVLARTSGRHGIFTVAPGQYRLGAEFGLASKEQLVRVSTNRLTSVSITLTAARLELDTIGPDSGTGLNAGAPARYRVFKAGADGGIDPIVEIESAQPLLRLPAGDFTVEAERGGLIARESISLDPGEPGSLRLVLGGGLLNVTATALGQPLPEAAIQLSVTPISQGGADTGPPLGLGPISGQPFTLPAGRYRLAGRIEPGGALAENIFILNAGSEQSTSVDFTVGQARLQVLAKAKGKVLENAFVIIQPQGNGDVIKLIGGENELRLAPGVYKVVAGAGTRRAEGELNIVAGNLEDLSLVPK